MGRFGIPRVPSSLTLRIPLRPSEYKYIPIDLLGSAGPSTAASSANTSASNSPVLKFTSSSHHNALFPSRSSATTRRWCALSTSLKVLLVTLASFACLALQIFIVVVIKRRYEEIALPDQTDAPNPYPWRDAYPLVDYAPIVTSSEASIYTDPYAHLKDRGNACAGPDGHAIKATSYMRRIPYNHPDPAFGSYDLINYTTPCMTYHQRYDPYHYPHVNTTTTKLDWRASLDACFLKHPRKTRQVVLIRAWQGFDWVNKDSTLNLRALISEVGLNTGGEMDVVIMVEVKDGSAFLASDKEKQRVLNEVPLEFRDLVVLWSEHEMHGYYPGLDSVYGGNPIHGAYRGLFMAVQRFAVEHPEYDYIWHWELDIRYIGNYYELFRKSAIFAKREPHDPTLRRAQKYLIPEYRNWSMTTGESPANKDKPLDYKEADLITFNIIFDQIGSKWVFEPDVIGYPNGTDTPRRGSIITASRLSRDLLLKMHTVNADLRQANPPEAFPATVALHYGYKAVYVPHPVYMERHWEPIFQNKWFNARDLFRVEDMFEGTSYYYRNWHARDIYLRWRNDEARVPGEDICRMPVLLHPIKDIDDIAVSTKTKSGKAQ